MSSHVKLSFRHAPLKVPVKKPVFVVPDIEQPSKSPKESPKRVPTSFKIYYFLPLLLLFYFVIPKSRPVRTLIKLKCSLHHRKMSCKGVPKGTFVVEVSEKCSQGIYEVDGVPFNIAKDKDMYRVPAKSLEVRNIDGDCMPRAYLDSNPISKTVPFSWVTTSQHTWFSITVDGETVVEKADVLFFEKVKHGNWISYSFDMDVRGKSVRVWGDGTDVIHVYGV